jgi:hypothetical protein
MARSITTSTDGLSNAAVRSALEELQISLLDLLFNTGALAIGTSSKKAVKLANTVYFMIDGVIYSKTTAETALAGTITADLFNVYLVSVNSAGTITITMGTEGATLAAVVFPAVPAGNVSLGFVIVNPTGTGNFVGGTTDLDDATVVPNAVYVNTPFPFNPNSLAL